VPRIVLAIAAGFSLATAASADVVELKTGQRVEGSLKQATPASVSIEIGGQVVTFEGEKVRAIYFGTVPAAQAATAPQPLRSDALRALKAVQSATAGGISYRDYAPRVTDAKIVVDRYLAEEKGDQEAVRTAIGASMKYFTLASSMWNDSITRPVGRPRAGDPRLASLPRDPAVRECVPDHERVGFLLTANLSTLWSCAADRIAEAEKLLGPK
jgi:hypothetical protein